MKNEKQIERWVEEKIITKEQAQRMLQDVQEVHKEEKSNKLITAISIIGAIFLGIGTILFIATNWQTISSPIKILLAVLVTFGSYSVGYLFKYQKQNLPKVGSALLFLGAILFGGTVMLIAQIYHVNANAHFLVLIWLVGVLPLVYGFKSESIAALSSLLFLIWIGLFIFRNEHFSQTVFFFLPAIYVLSGSLLFSIGGLHYVKRGFSKIARIFRLFGIKIVMLSLFLLTFKMFSGGSFDNSWMSGVREISNLPPSVITGIVLFSVLSIAGMVASLFLNPSQAKNNSIENGLGLGIIGFVIVSILFPATTHLYVFLYNIIFAILTGALIYFGYERTDISLVNTGIFWLALFIVAKYFDLFWGRMQVSLFFLVGGMILVLGGIILEGKRRKIKEVFKSVNA